MNFSLTFSDKELDYVCNVLAQRPYGEVAQLLANIKQQVDEQNQRPVPADGANIVRMNGAQPTQ